MSDNFDLIVIGGGPGGYGSGMGGVYSRRWNPHMKNVNNYNSPIAQVLAQREANKYNNLLFGVSRWCH